MTILSTSIIILYIVLSFALEFYMNDSVGRGINYSSVINGKWTKTSTWGAAGPALTTNDNVTINTTVYDAAPSTNTLTIQSGGKLIVKSNGSLTVYSLTLDAGSLCIVETGGRLIVRNNFYNRTGVTNNGSITVANTFRNY